MTLAVAEALTPNKPKTIKIVRGERIGWGHLYMFLIDNSQFSI